MLSQEVTDLFKKRKTTVEKSFRDSKQNHKYSHTLFKSGRKNQAYTRLICVAQNMKNTTIKRSNIDKNVHNNYEICNNFIRLSNKAQKIIKENHAFFQMRGLSRVCSLLS